MTPLRQQIIVIDKQEQWRNLWQKALHDAGYAVSIIDRYEADLPAWNESSNSPALVILGCATIGPDEHKLIGRILHRKYHLVVISTSQPDDVIRSVFLLGAKDVVDNKNFDPEWLVRTVETVLEDIRPRSAYDCG
jgi:DNA-binding NtrC family response regulator